MAVESHFYLRENENGVKGAGVPRCVKRQASWCPRPPAAPTPTGGHDTAAQMGRTAPRALQVSGMPGDKGRGPAKAPFCLVFGSWLVSQWV